MVMVRKFKCKCGAEFTAKSSIQSTSGGYYSTHGRSSNYHLWLYRTHCPTCGAYIVAGESEAPEVEN